MALNIRRMRNRKPLSAGAGAADLPAYFAAIRDGGLAPAVIRDGVALYGDSMAGDSSGGGGDAAYLSGPATLGRFLSAAGLPSTVLQFGVGGVASSHTLAAWLARGEFWRYNVIETGRNENWPVAGTVAGVLVNIDAIIASRRAGEILIFAPVSNQATEYAGGALAANYTNIAAFNSGLAARANGVDIFIADTRKALVDSFIFGDSADLLANGRDLPAPSLLVDGLHRNSAGTEISARVRFRTIYNHWLVANPRVNLVVDGTFPSLTNWNASGGGWTVSGGVAQSSGAAAWRSISQQILASGATGKNFLVMWDYANYRGNIALHARPYTGGGSAYAPRAGFTSAMSSPAVPYNPGLYRAGPSFAVVVAATEAQFAILFETQDDTTAQMGVRNVIVHEVA